MSAKLTIKLGDATRPDAGGDRYILHVCNDIGGWGSGFVISVSKRWPQPEAVYRDEYKRGLIKLGVVSTVKVENDIWVCNMVAQRGIGSRSSNFKEQLNDDGLPPIRYDALQTCMTMVQYGLDTGRCDFPSIHVPYKMGADRAGGDWEKIVDMMYKTFCVNDIPVTAYKLDK